MSEYYTAKRSRNLFDPSDTKPFKLSRSKIDLFFECPRCFYLDRRLGVGRPPGFPFNLNSAVDALLKKEFDIHRVGGTTHPLMKTYGIAAVPFDHSDVDKWRDVFNGIAHHHKPTNFWVYGAIDDIWKNDNGELHLVDYKSTSKSGKVAIDADWQGGYRRQMETYQWLFRKNDFNVSDTGYFVYANATRDKKAFDGVLEFDVTVLPYKGSDGWLEQTLLDAHACLTGDAIPAASSLCDYCAYRNAATDVIPAEKHSQEKPPEQKQSKRGTLF